jgi:pSer/pThr/pTyr-binding forkhead associated (FHA) protein
MNRTNRFPSYSTGSQSLNPSHHAELQERLGLYQVFLKLYEHNRSLLDEILSLENANPQASRMALPYIQGQIHSGTHSGHTSNQASGQQVSLITNLMNGRTEATQQPQNTWLIGRDSSRVHISLPDRRLSRCHAMIHFADGPSQGFYLTDLSSSNGSFVNGEMILEPTLLKDGDRIRLGSLSFTFFLCHSTQIFPAFNSHHPNVTDRTDLTSLSQQMTEIELLESAPPPETNFDPLEDTCCFIRKGHPSEG